MRIRNPYIDYASAIFLLVLLLSFPYAESYAESGSNPDIKPFMIIDADKQFEFAEHYFSSRNYHQAINEYQRFIYFFPQDGRIELARFKIGMAQFKSQQFNNAVKTFKTLTDQYGETDLGIKSYLMISKSYVKLDAYDAAIINLHNLAAITDDTNIQDEAYYRIGWLYLETASWENARRYFSKITPVNQDKYGLPSLVADLENKTFIPTKNPTIAGVLSVLPGAGQVYCERYRDALIAVLLNGVLFYAAYESFDNDQNAVGGVLTVIGLGFYAGNIYGAASSAHKYNRTQTVQFIQRLKQTHELNLSAGFSSKGFRLTVKVPF